MSRTAIATWLSRPIITRLLRHRLQIHPWPPRSAAATEKAEFAENGLHLGALTLEILPHLGTVEIHLGPEMTLEIRLPFLALGRRREHGLPERDLGGTEFRRTARAAPRP